MKKLLNGFFMALGVIFFILILIGVYLFVADPYNIKPLLFGSESNTPAEQPEAAASNKNTSAREPASDKNPILNQNQEAALEAVGINPANIPNEVSPQQQRCFEDTLGADRVAAITAGDTPSATEIFTARNCL